MGEFDFISLMLIINILVLIGLFFFEFSTHWILGYFFMIYIANYINFIGLNLLVRRLPTAEGPMLKKKTNIWFITMNCLYAVALILALIPYTGPYCYSTALYPWMFTYIEALLVLNAIYHHYLHYQNYYLKWEKSGEVIKSAGKEHELGLEPIEVIKPVFLAQMKSYICF